MKQLVSKIHPEMNNFFLRLEKALNVLPDNPKPQCEGFFIAYYDNITGITTCEPLGEIPSEKWFKYNYFAQKKCAQVQYLNKMNRKYYRSADFAENDEALELFPGGVKIGDDSSGTSGHHSKVDEAISALRLLATPLQRIHGSTYLNSSIFGSQLQIHAHDFRKRFAQDNNFIAVLSNLIAMQA